MSENYISGEALKEFWKTKKFEKATTVVKAAHITRVTSIFTVTAKAEQMPRI